jgi:predicted aconitase
MRLTEIERDMLEGRRGWPLQLAMDMLVAVGRAYDAEAMIPVGSAHLVIDGTALGEPGVELFERLVRHGARFAVPVSINAIAVDRLAAARGERLSDAQRGQLRLLEACERMGALASCSCNPFIQGILPRFGEAVAWSESATAPYVNSVIGARTNREGATALASALAGVTPKYGMHLDSARRGGVLFHIDAPMRGLHDYNLLGTLIGRRAAGRLPVLAGLPRPSRDELVGFGAAFAIVCAEAMYHIVGVTPEAPTLEAAFAGPPPPPIVIGKSDLVSERARTESATGDHVDVISIGCPHASLEQMREVASLVAGRSVRPDVKFFLHTNRTIHDDAVTEGLLEPLARAGIRVTTDNCAVVSYDRLPVGTTLATNSTKMALFAKAVSGAAIRYGSVAECVSAALAGADTGRRRT